MYARGTTRHFLQTFPLSGTPVVQSYRAWIWCFKRKGSRMTSENCVPRPSPGMRITSKKTPANCRCAGDTLQGMLWKWHLKIILTTPTPHICKKHASEICHTTGGSPGSLQALLLPPLLQGREIHVPIPGPPETLYGGRMILLIFPWKLFGPRGWKVWIFGVPKFDPFRQRFYRNSSAWGPKVQAFKDNFRGELPPPSSGVRYVEPPVPVSESFPACDDFEKNGSGTVGTVHQDKILHKSHALCCRYAIGPRWSWNSHNISICNPVIRCGR